MSSAARRGTAGDGARVGAAIGTLALAIGLHASGWWLTAAIPAGAVAGAWAGPRVAAGERIRVRIVVAAAAVATVVGSAVVSAALTLESGALRDGPMIALGVALSGAALGLLSIGWFALVVLLPVAATAMVIVRSRASRSRNALSVPPGGAWLGGLVVGFATGSLALILPVAGYEIALLFVVGALLGRGSLAAIAGLALGAGGGWMALIANGILSCRQDGCVAPDYVPWLAVGAGMAAVGGALSVVAVRRG